MSLLSLKPEPVVGIDISSTAIKLVELTRAGKDSYQVENYAIEPLADKIIEDKAINAAKEDAADIVGQAVARVVGRTKPKTQQAAVAVSGPGVITKIITMDMGMSERDILEALQTDTGYLQLPEEEDFKIDFEVLGPNEKESETRIDVLVAAARANTVDTLVSAMELGGLKTKVVDIEKYALENAFLLIAENDPDINAQDETIALVEVGATTTTMNILGNLQIIFTREELFGGRSLTEEIQHRYGLSYEEANVAKRESTLPEDYESDVLDPFRVEMAQQISRMVQYYYSMEVSSKYGNLSHVLIAGGCASIPGIVEQVSNKVGGHVSIANPFSLLNMSISSKVNKDALMIDAPALMTAFGLALRTFDTHY